MSVEARSAEAAGGIEYGSWGRSRFLLRTVRALCYETKYEGGGASKTDKKRKIDKKREDRE